MSSLTVPVYNLPIQSAGSPVALAPQTVLAISQANIDNTAPFAIIENPATNRIDDLVGSDSMAGRLYKRFREINKITELDIYPLSLAGDPAKATITITGIAEENKTIVLNIADDEFVVELFVNKNETNQDIVARLVREVNMTDIPFMANVKEDDATTMEIVFKHAGAFNNDLLITHSEIAGFKIVTTVFAEGTGGVEEFDIANIKKRYNYIIFDKNIAPTKIGTYLDSIFNKSNQIKAGIGFTAGEGDESELDTLADSVDYKSLLTWGNLTNITLNAIPILVLAEMVAIVTLRLAEGAFLGKYVIPTEEKFGSIARASLPYHMTPMSYKPPKGTVDVEVLERLEAKGISFIVQDGNRTVIRDLVTTYKTNEAGQPDTIFHYLNHVQQALAYRELLFLNVNSSYAMTRATKKQLTPNLAETNVNSVRGDFIRWYREAGDVDHALVESGAEAIAFFDENLKVSLDTFKGKYSISLKIQLKAQFKKLNAVISVAFDI